MSLWTCRECNETLDIQLQSVGLALDRLKRAEKALGSVLYFGKKIAILF